MKITLNCRHLHNHTHCCLWIDGNHAALVVRWNIFGVVCAQTVRMVLMWIINDCWSTYLTSESVAGANGGWNGTITTINSKTIHGDKTYPRQVIPQGVCEVLGAFIETDGNAVSDKRLFDSSQAAQRQRSSVMALQKEKTRENHYKLCCLRLSVVLWHSDRRVLWFRHWEWHNSQIKERYM